MVSYMISKNTTLLVILLFPKHCTKIKIQSTKIEACYFTTINSHQRDNILTEFSGYNNNKYHVRHISYFSVYNKY